MEMKAEFEKKKTIEISIGANESFLRKRMRYFKYEMGTGGSVIQRVIAADLHLLQSRR